MVSQTSSVTDTYGDVDSSADPEAAVAWQEEMASWPTIAAYKRRTHELLRSREPVLDLGVVPATTSSR